jgi:4-hydroxybenzoate polyprenyltransferase
VRKKLYYLLFALRPEQGIKNLLIFLPLIFGKKLFIFPRNVEVAASVVLFSLAAGAAYLINDVIDYEQDKAHPVKSARPVVSGELTKKDALIAASVLGIISVALSFTVDILLGWIAVLYLAANLAYSAFLKKLPMIDVSCLALFFYMRILAGGVAAQVELSSLIVIMTILLAFFLGFIKRRQELKLMEAKSYYLRPACAKYDIRFLDGSIALLTVAITAAYGWYAFNRGAWGAFANPHLAYSIPFVYYGILRYLYVIYVQRRQEDTARILLLDTHIQLSMLLWLSVCIGAIYFGL